MLGEITSVLRVPFGNRLRSTRHRSQDPAGHRARTSFSVQNKYATEVSLWMQSRSRLFARVGRAPTSRPSSC